MARVASALLLDVAVVSAGLVSAVVTIADKLLLAVIAVALLTVARRTLADDLSVAVLTSVVGISAVSTGAENELVGLAGVAGLGVAPVIVADNAVGFAGRAVGLRSTPVTVADNVDVDIDIDIDVDGADLSDGGDLARDSSGDGLSDGGSDVGSELEDSEENAAGDLSSKETRRRGGTTTGLVGVTRAGDITLVGGNGVAIVEVVTTVAVLGEETEVSAAVTGRGAKVGGHAAAGGLESEASEVGSRANTAEEGESANTGRVAGSTSAGAGGAAGGASAGLSASGGVSDGASQGTSDGAGDGVGVSSSDGAVLSQSQVAHGEGDHWRVTHLDGVVWSD